MTLTPEQRTISTELVSRGTGINCFEEAELLLDTVANLIARGLRPTVIHHWLTILPRAKKLPDIVMHPPVVTQLTITTPVADLPEPLRRAVEPPTPHRTGARAGGNPEWLLNPELAPTKLKKRGRPAVGSCRVCGTQFPMNQVGRPADTCLTHRRKTPPKKEAS